MITFRKHRPAFIDGPVIEDENYASFDDLMNSDYVKKWESTKDFSYFAKSDNYIMCILKNGFVWWVIGSFNVESQDKINLPQWGGGKYIGIENGIKQVFTRKEVQSVCGDELRLKDGRILELVKDV